MLPGFNSSLWAKQVSSRFADEYTEKRRQELSGPSGGVLEVTVNLVKASG